MRLHVDRSWWWLLLPLLAFADAAHSWPGDGAGLIPPKASDGAVSEGAGRFSPPLGALVRSPVKSLCSSSPCLVAGAVAIAANLCM